MGALDLGLVTPHLELPCKRPKPYMRGCKHRPLLWGHLLEGRALGFQVKEGILKSAILTQSSNPSKHNRASWGKHIPSLQTGRRNPANHSHKTLVPPFSPSLCKNVCRFRKYTAAFGIAPLLGPISETRKGFPTS